MTRIREEEDLKTQSLSWSWRRFGCKCWSLMVTGRARADSLEPQQARLIDWSYVLVCCLLQVRSRHSLLTAFLYVTPFERRAALDLRCYYVLRHSCSRARNTLLRLSRSRVFLTIRIFYSTCSLQFVVRKISYVGYMFNH